MRLIDAEHLIQKAEQENKDGALEDDELETIYYELSDEPTVDAIPIEWIEDFIDDIGDLEDEMSMRAVYSLLINEWRKEND